MVHTQWKVTWCNARTLIGWPEKYPIEGKCMGSNTCHASYLSSWKKNTLRKYLNIFSIEMPYRSEHYGGLLPSYASKGLHRFNVEVIPLVQWRANGRYLIKFPWWSAMHCLPPKTPDQTHDSYILDFSIDYQGNTTYLLPEMLILDTKKWWETLNMGELEGFMIFQYARLHHILS